MCAGARSRTAPNGASPSLRNGGLGQNEIFPALLLFTIGTGLLEETDMSSRKANGCAWNEYPASFGTFGRQPGNFGFDPLNFYRPLNAAEKVQVQERELLNGLSPCSPSPRTSPASL